MKSKGYLVVSRRVSERLQIGDDVEILISDITVNKQGHKKVDIAIRAPKDLKITRPSSYLNEKGE